MRSICIFLASQNKNRALADQVAAVFSESYNVEIIDLVALDWPLYSTHAQSNMTHSESIHHVISIIQQSVGFIFVSPEYNGSIPPVLSNTVAWLSVTSSSWRDLFFGKLAMISTFSGGGGEQLIASLRIMLGHLGLNVLGLPLVANGQKPLNPDSLNKNFKQFQRYLG